MDWLTFISLVIDSVAWPFALVATIILLRKELVEAIGRVQSIKHNETQIEFSNRIHEASREAEISLPETATPDTKTFARRIKLAELSPRGAILESWLDVETALEEMGSRYGISAEYIKRSSIHRLQVQLGDYNSLGKGAFNLLQRLKETRNEAVHLTDKEVKTDAAKEYISMANRMVTLLDEA
ncbi:hypothetical protein [Marinimicrobium agarilyticum]|uniref:hypothetical protein n=1 Tax=Marinimicrobium agarilyticum TaxID=306546 RepID=UPI00048221DA|nr:hypothetical protein [Marinimicrobium agarilyticum]